MSRDHKKPTLQDILRLDAIAKHLKVKSSFGDSAFPADVKAACLARVAPTYKKLLPCTGEEIALGLGENLCLKFEEVHGPQDVVKLEDHYLKGKKEIGFAQLRDELENPDVDALLFQRINAQAGDPDSWVAVLNLQGSGSKAYWNRFHELSHRIAEPPQKILPFRRHKFEASNPVEALIDSVAAEMAFYEPVFRPLVESYAKTNTLSFEVMDQIREQYAPTASLLSTMKAVVRYWPRAAASLTAEYRGRLNSPSTDRALRVSSQGHNDHASRSGLTFWPNMRAPLGSPIHQAFVSNEEQNAVEHLENWQTSTGKSLAAINVFTSARFINGRVYAVLSK
jgi:hypothetical protein